MRNPVKPASHHPVRAPSRRWFVGTALAFAFVLACQAFWILTAEFCRPSPIGFPPNTQSTTAATRNAAHRAVLFGLIRGDLWVDFALTYPDLFRYNELSHPSARASEMIEQARKAAEHALAYAPYDARIWLGLANIDSRFGWPNRKASAALRMSYYTGTNEIELIPLRLSLSASLPAISDAEFQQLVRHDIRTAVTHQPELKSAVLDAYRHALPVAQQFMAETLKDIDPALLSSLKSN